MDNRNERRKYSRIKIKWPVTILADHGSLQGEALNIHSEGIFVYCGEPLSLNREYQMSVSPPNHKALAIRGKVVWSDLYGLDNEQNTYGMGVCFMEITDEDRHFLEEMLKMDPGNGTFNPDGA